jgi:hypothetical protein
MNGKLQLPDENKIEELINTLYLVDVLKDENIYIL